MTRAEALAELRSEILSDSVAPYAWSDDFLIRAMAEGQDKFCFETGFFLDKTNYTITTEAGVKSYALSPRIIKVLEVWDGARGLRRFTELDRPGRSGEAEQNVRPSNWQTDAETGAITFFEPPLADIVITLRVWRYSQFRLDHKTAGAYDKDFEIPEQFQRACLEYAAFKAYGQHDRERQDPIKAGDHLRNFKDYCSDGAQAFRLLRGDEGKLEPNPLYSFR